MQHLNGLGPFSFFLLTEVVLPDALLSPGKTMRKLLGPIKGQSLIYLLISRLAGAVIFSRFNAAFSKSLSKHRPEEGTLSLELQAKDHKRICMPKLYEERRKT
jgi:hypothetical protein